VSLLGAPSPIRYAQSIDLPYSPGQIFDLVADIERYPEFLYEYREARIHARNGNMLLVDQVIGLPLLNVSLRAEATFNRPDFIVVRARPSTLGNLEVRWAFLPIPGGAHVDFHMALTPSSRLGAGLAEYLIEKSAARTLQAFAARAAELCEASGGDRSR
jgi:coenzyme Q-binding protein COQ10